MGTALGRTVGDSDGIALGKTLETTVGFIVETAVGVADGNTEGEGEKVVG